MSPEPSDLTPPTERERARIAVILGLGLGVALALLARIARRRSSS